MKSGTDRRGEGTADRTRVAGRAFQWRMRASADENEHRWFPASSKHSAVIGDTWPASRPTARVIQLFAIGVRVKSG